MKNLIILDRNDLKELLQEMLPAIRSAEPKDTGKPYLSINEGLQYLNDRGLKMSKSTLYKHTMNESIPFQRFGERKIVFLREELDEWIEERLSGNDNTLNNAV
jgi:excisionase family DNA binding protein